MVAFLGTISALLYPVISPIIGLTAEQYCLWSSFIAHAALACATGEQRFYSS
jgi:uncharacterized membrane protein YadS